MPTGIYKRSEETRRKMSAIARKRRWSEESKKKMSEARKKWHREHLGAVKGKNNPMYDKQFTEEHRKKLSDAAKGRISWNKGTRGVMKVNKTSFKKGHKNSDVIRKKISEALKGRKHSEETKRKLSASLKGHSVSEEARRKISESQMSKKSSEGTKRKQSEARKKYLEEHPEVRDSILFKKGHIPWIKGKHHSEESRRKNSETKKKYYKKHPEIIKKLFKHLHIKPTNPEKQFIEICRKYNLPFKYVGDGKFWIENINPDFVDCNGRKIVVEIFGSYWHSPIHNSKISYNRTYEGRKKILKKYGWKCIIFWDYELSNEKNVLDGLLLK